MSEVLLTRREGAVLVLSNNNPAARNALSPEFYAALTQALAQAQADPAVGAIVLTGEGGHFCSGGDLRQLARRRELPVEERRAQLEGLHALLRGDVEELPRPQRADQRHERGKRPAAEPDEADGHRDGDGGKGDAFDEIGVHRHAQLLTRPKRRSRP